jgi:drug/metabolite transporter (DMT)-like permease
MTLRRLSGMTVVLVGLVLVSGVDAASLTLRAAVGDAMFLVAGTLWSGFGIVLRKHRLDPLLTTSVISFSALLTYVPAYLFFTGGEGLLASEPNVFWVEVLIQGVIAGAGTLYTYSKMVSLLGPSRASVFPALAPGLAALLAWPVLGHVPATFETLGLLLVMAGLLVAVTSSTTQAKK